MSLIPINLLDDNNIKNLRNKFQAVDAYYTSKLLCEEYGEKIKDLRNNKFYKSYIIDNTDIYDNIANELEGQIKLFKQQLEQILVSGLKNNQSRNLVNRITNLENRKKDFQYSNSVNLRNSVFYNLYFQIDKDNILPFFVGLNKTNFTASYYIVNSNLKEKFCGCLNIFGINKEKFQNNFSKNFAYIDWIFPAGDCGVPLNGNKILKIFLNLCRLHNVYRVDLQDESKIVSCAKTSKEYSNIDLRLYKIFKDGMSWYEKNGFLPCKESNLRQDLIFHKPNKTNFKLSFKSEEYKKFYEKYKSAIKYIRNYDTRGLLLILNEVFENPSVYVSETLLKKDIIKLGSFITILEKYHKKNVFKLGELMERLYKKDCAYYHMFVKFILGKGTLFKNNKPNDIISIVLSNYTLNFNKNKTNKNSGNNSNKNSGNNSVKNSGNNISLNDTHTDKLLDLLSSIEILSKVYYYSKVFEY